MKALTICQPYAELICLGEKRVENRRWRASYRGPLLIHAGKSRDWLDTHSPLPERMEFGCIVARCRLADYVKYDQAIRLPEWRWLRTHDHASGPYCWILQEVQRLERPIPYRGQRGLFDVDEAELEMHDAHWLPAGEPAPRCRVCGCTEHAPCAEGCYWVEPDLCSACEQEAARVAAAQRPLFDRGASRPF